METEKLHEEQVAEAGLDATTRAIESIIETPPEAENETAQVCLNPSLLAICRAMGQGLQLNEVLNTILELTMERMNAQQGSILLFDEHQDRLQMLASFGLPDEIVDKGYIPRKGSIAEWVIERNEPLILHERPRDSEFTPLDSQRRIVSSMCVPLNARGGVIGTLNLNRTLENAPPFGRDELGDLTILAGQAAIYIENSRLHEQNLRSERLAAIGQTVAGISHCIKNLMTGMKGGVSLVKLGRQQEEWEIVEQAHEILSNSVERISSLVWDMLDYSREREHDIETVDLDGLLKELRGVTREKSKERGVEIVFETACDARMVKADSQQLFRCLLNLIENALDATPENQKITVSAVRSQAEGAMRRLTAEEAEAAVVIRVADEGPGISEANSRQIFEPFFSTKGSKGTGLGLAVSHKIIAEHGGRLELESPPGQPAVFAIYLPAA